MPLSVGSLRYAAVSDRAHNALLDLIATGFLLYGLVLLGDVFAVSGAFATLWALIYALLILWAGVGFKKRKGGAFLFVSGWLLVMWLVQFVRAIVAFDRGESTTGLIVSFLLITFLIGYLGRWPMERRFRPHLEH